MSNWDRLADQEDLVKAKSIAALSVNCLRFIPH